MKKLSFIYILVCVGFIANAQLQHEDFNATSMPDGWSATNADNGQSWTFGYKNNLKGSGIQNPASFQSGGVVFNDYDSGDFNHNVVSLTSPTINLEQKNIVEASIEITYNLRAFAGDGSFNVYVWDGVVWQNILTESENTSLKNSGENKTAVLDVSAFINSDFKVKFVYDDENSRTWGVGIDDYKLMGVEASKVEGLESIGFKYYPNPVTDGELTLLSSKEISSINVYNSIGQRIMFKESLNLESKLDMQHLASGAYVVKVNIGENTGVFKVIKP
ncbi:T9SS type A sorting domain-containing protein [Aureibaculum sp. 2210JD6-5]|uniref:T9SS type A sorting domain-containing protein n=1 Tax=Aureibaculum sp. 2210JD6-5 TaxID=3103957 RepID=UPI002AAED2D0|nr:T9SS type A sorting domain-containing protein [Aureibaculum sp. 2210JD6-5]MDY7394162.1 T9SS type A sorting domain-containing protein [Aureibaculum sp. 2210JD6-5]